MDARIPSHPRQFRTWQWLLLVAPLMMTSPVAAASSSRVERRTHTKVSSSFYANVFGHSTVGPAENNDDNAANEELDDGPPTMIIVTIDNSTENGKPVYTTDSVSSSTFLIDSAATTDSSLTHDTTTNKERAGKAGIAKSSKTKGSKSACGKAGGKAAGKVGRRKLQSSPLPSKGSKAICSEPMITEPPFSPIVTRDNILDCGCSACDATVLDTLTGSDGIYTCRNHIEWLVSQGSLERDACATVAAKYSASCGVCSCSVTDSNNETAVLIITNDTPFTVDNQTAAAEDDDGMLGIPIDIPTGVVSDDKSYCSCDVCDATVLNTRAGNAGVYTCRDRISWLISQGTTEDDACLQVAGEYVDTCGQCSCKMPPAFETTIDSGGDGDPITPETNKTYCGCSKCDTVVLGSVTDADGQYTCHDRIEWLLSQGIAEPDACLRVADEYNTICGSCSCGLTPTVNGTATATEQPRESPANETYCGCSACDNKVLDTPIDANGQYTCRDHIEWLLSQGSSEVDACRQVAGVEHPSKCGSCVCGNADGTAGDDLTVGDEDKYSAPTVSPSIRIPTATIAVPTLSSGNSATLTPTFNNDNARLPPVMSADFYPSALGTSSPFSNSIGTGVPSVSSDSVFTAPTALNHVGSNTFPVAGNSATHAPSVASNSGSTSYPVAGISGTNAPSAASPVSSTAFPIAGNFATSAPSVGRNIGSTSFPVAGNIATSVPSVGSNIAATSFPVADGVTIAPTDASIDDYTTAPAASSIVSTTAPVGSNNITPVPLAGDNIDITFPPATGSVRATASPVTADVSVTLPPVASEIVTAPPTSGILTLPPETGVSGATSPPETIGDSATPPPAPIDARGGKAASGKASTNLGKVRSSKHTVGKRGKSSDSKGKASKGIKGGGSKAGNAGDSKGKGSQGNTGNIFTESGENAPTISLSPVPSPYVRGETLPTFSISPAPTPPFALRKSETCSTIQSGKGDTSGPHLTFNVDFILVIQGDLIDTYRQLEDFLSTTVALALAGCSGNASRSQRELMNGDVTNVVFDVTEDATMDDGACNIPTSLPATAAAGSESTWHHVKAIVDIYFEAGEDVQYSETELFDLLQGYCKAVSRLTGVDDTYNPCESMKVTSVATVHDGADAAPAKSRERSGVSPGGVSAVATAFMLLIVLLIMVARRQQDVRQRQHHDIDGYDDRIYLKTDYDGAESLATTAENSNSESLQAHIHGDGEADSVVSGWSNFTPSTPTGEAPRFRTFDDDHQEVRLHQYQTPNRHRRDECPDDESHDDGYHEHICSSPTCSACEQRRSASLKFRPRAMPAHGSTLPRNATRAYQEGDTVQL